MWSFYKRADSRPARNLAPVAIIAGTLLLALTLGACSITFPTVGVTQGSGTLKTETRSVSGFTSVVLSGIGTLNIQQTGIEALSIKTDDNLLPLLTSTVNGGVLTLGVKPVNNPRPTSGITWNLTVKSLTGITLSGAGTINVQNLSATSLTALVSGAGTINVQNLNTTSLTALVSGAGTLTISGSAPSQTVTVSGVGNYKGRDFATANTTVTISGTGSAIVAASATLNATVSGAGSVTYYGTPQVTKTITGVGSIKQGT